MDISTIKFNKDGLVPAIVCDCYTNQVLMQAYMNEESLKMTLETKKATYFSRSRNKLWLKGESSGHFQEVVSICSDCDNDCILMRVKQIGVACHTGAYSCFFNNETEFESVTATDALYDTINAIKDRAETPQEGSYTNYLLEKGKEKICKKIGEEASEMIIGAMKGDKDELCSESADFIYHLLVLLHDQNASLEQVLSILKSRHSSPRKRNY